ncbi:MAG: sulfate ABC transporter substrate-binding protein [Deltaproteobacteria bacterium]|nr:sulfate ABC transporter substrate-binding protein [Deltaproteobacteria bacterium]
MFGKLLFIVIITLGANIANAEDILNVSYDPTRELYVEFNKAFKDHWKSKTGQTININQSHGGSGKQARAVIDGLEADVVTLALAYDIDAIAKRSGLLPTNWQSRLPHNSCPYTSTIVFLTRKGNPKNIRDWPDLARPDVTVITPNPKTSGGARWNYLAAWAYGLAAGGNDEARAKAFITLLFLNVPVLDSGARGSTMTFINRKIGDVLITWENEAFLAKHKFEDEVEIVMPSLSILAEPPVALIDKMVDAHGTRKIAEAYLEYLFTEKGQILAAEHYYRPTRPLVAKIFEKQFAKIRLVRISDFGGWAVAQHRHFDDGGVFDEIYKPRR